MENLNQILQLPERCLVNKKITKAFFKRNFDLTLTERKLLDDSAIITQIDWIASLKPNQINIEGFNNNQTVFEEVQVISVFTETAEFDKIKTKIIDLIQKHIPYHILLCVYSSKEFVINTCEKRINLNDSNRRTIEKTLITENILVNNETDIQKIFLNDLLFENIDKHDLKSLYDSYSKSIVALQASSINGEFISRPIEQSKKDLAILERIKKLESEIILLQNQASKESQLNTQVKINAEVQFRRSEITKLKNELLI
jgi:hypothetical protein